MGDCPPLSLLGMATASSNPSADSSSSPSSSNNMTYAHGNPETPADVASFAASLTSVVPTADVSLAVSSFLTQV